MLYTAYSEFRRRLKNIRIQAKHFYTSIKNFNLLRETIRKHGNSSMSYETKLTK